MNAFEVVWRVPMIWELRWERFGEEAILYNPASGRTHRVNELVVDILESLGSEPATFADLSRRMGVAGLGPAEEEYFSGLLRQLDRLGFIEPCY
ncbi:MAG: HPr-rel-A system PqqD family peptide chaperone [Magnetococcales bacterium]|nr:HPr-rel-A system PqqD family peptide chaperone [Magnetococcales bacterium]